MFTLKIKKTTTQELFNQKSDLIIDPIKQGVALKVIARILSSIYLKTHNFKFNKKDINYKFLDEPCLIIMNHVYETDFKIAFKILGKSKFNICAARDAFLGRKKVVQSLGGLSVVRFTHDPVFVKNAYKCINNLKQSLLIYPEGEYSADGLSLGIPPQFSRFIKLLKVPVLFLRSYGTYAMQPMYNASKNKNKISATLKEVLSKEEIEKLSDVEIQNIISKLFTDIDYNNESRELGIKITNKNRADKLERILYRCPVCGDDHSMEGKGINIVCKKCGAKFTLTEEGRIIDCNNKVIFDSVSEWTNYERKELKKEILNNKYQINFKAKVYAFKNYSALYDINQDATVYVNREHVILKYANKNFVYNYKDKYAICSTLNCLSLGPTLIVDIDDINYLLCPYIDNGDLFKIRIAVPIIYKINKSK